MSDLVVWYLAGATGAILEAPTRAARTSQPKRLGGPSSAGSWCGKFSICPKLIVPLQIDRAIGFRRYLLGRWLTQARQMTIGAVNRRRSQLAPSLKRRTVAGVAGVSRIRGPERGGRDDRARIGYTPGPPLGADREATGLLASRFDPRAARHSRVGGGSTEPSIGAPLSRALGSPGFPSNAC